MSHLRQRQHGLVLLLLFLLWVSMLKGQEQELYEEQHSKFLRPILTYEAPSPPAVTSSSLEASRFQSLYSKDPVLVICLFVVVIALSIILTTFIYVHIHQMQRAKKKLQEDQKKVNADKLVALDQGIAFHSSIFLKNLKSCIRELDLENVEDIEAKCFNKDQPCVKVSKDLLLSYMRWLSKAYDGAVNAMKEASDPSTPPSPASQDTASLRHPSFHADLSNCCVLMHSLYPSSSSLHPMTQQHAQLIDPFYLHNHHHPCSYYTSEEDYYESNFKPTTFIS